MAAVLPSACQASRGLMTSLYFDDASIMDWRSGKGGAQAALLCFAKAVGSPFAPEKHQTMNQEGDFLGLWHDCTMTHYAGQAQFWVRERLQTDFIEEALCSKRMTPATASKFFGCLTFLTTGCYGKLMASMLLKKGSARPRHWSMVQWKMLLLG